MKTTSDSLPRPDPGIFSRFFRGLFSWPRLRIGLVVLVGLITLIALFYAEEDWRGKRAWENCKRELAAEGFTLDWNAYIPSPVPDDQNFFKAPKMQTWFVGRGQTELSKRFSRFERQYGVVAAVVQVVTSGAAPAKADLVLQYDESSTARPAPAVQKRLFDLGRRTLTTATNGLRGPILRGSRGVSFVAQPLHPVEPAHIAVQARTMPDADGMAKLFPAFTVEPAGSNSFRLLLNSQPFYSAADYLAWSDPFESDFDLIRRALQRPYALMPGDYHDPVTQPIPNFVCLRATAQTLSDRVRCNLLLGRPEKALRDLTLIHDMCRMLEGAPTGKPMTLVAAMINVAINGLYTDTIAIGLNLHAWHEPQLAALEAQLKDVNLPPQVRAALSTEPAAACQILEATPSPKLSSIFQGSTLDALGWWLWPRGWTYQNMANIATLEHRTLGVFDPTNDLILPDRGAALPRQLDQFERSRSPYTALVRMMVPNFSKAWKVLARNQTRANEARIACALERYRLAHHQYPEKLDVLVPRFIDRLPHDIIGGQPLKYRRTADDQFVLYSVGWNKTDDGGTVVTAIDKGDWVWPPLGN